MGQAITDYVKFLADARDAVYRLDCDQKTAGQLEVLEKEQERELEAAGRAVTDAVNQTVRKRLEEISSSYDKEIAKGQDRLKKARAKREKAKSRGMKERIAEETSELREHNRDLKVQMRTLFQKERVPSFCNSTFYYALYYPGGLKEIALFLLTLTVCFLAVPCGIYFFLLPERHMWYLAAVYFLDVLLFGGLYVLVGNKTRLRHQDALKRGRAIRNTLRANQKKIKVITHTIQRDGNEDIYDLEKYDDEIACVEQELSEITSKKKDALDGTSRSLKELEEGIKQQNIRITDSFGPYLGKEFLEPDRLSELSRIIQGGAASNITEAIGIYKESKQAQ